MSFGALSPSQTGVAEQISAIGTWEAIAPWLLWFLGLLLLPRLLRFAYRRLQNQESPLSSFLGQTGLSTATGGLLALLGMMTEHALAVHAPQFGFAFSSTLPWGLLGFLALDGLRITLGSLQRERDRFRALEHHLFDLRLQAARQESLILRETIKPHFLLNLLAALPPMIRRQPEQATDLIHHLGTYLQGVLHLPSQTWVPLGVLRKLSMEYLELEKIRMGERLQVEIVWPPEWDERQVPPLILLPLLENAITHGIRHIPQGGTLQLRVFALGENIHLEVENPIPPRPPEPHRTTTGLGLKGLEALLETIWPGRT